MVAMEMRDALLKIEIPGNLNGGCRLPDASYVVHSTDSELEQSRVSSHDS
jgi:hypothetical protein